MRRSEFQEREISATDSSSSSSSSALARSRCTSAWEDAASAIKGSKLKSFFHTQIQAAGFSAIPAATSREEEGEEEDAEEEEEFQQRVFPGKV